LPAALCDMINHYPMINYNGHTALNGARIENG
jgi:hypothetical protein